MTSASDHISYELFMMAKFVESSRVSIHFCSHNWISLFTYSTGGTDLL